MVFRNSVYNILGLGLPLIVAVIAIPALIKSLGVAQFGVLTIIWSVVSYFGLFDLGLGRAVTQQVAAALAVGNDSKLKAILGTSSMLMLGLGVVGGAAMLAATPYLASQFAHSANALEITRAFYWMAVAMPAIVLTSGYRGILEALGRFGLINAIRFPMGVFTYAGPLAVVWAGYGQLDTIAAVLCIGRIVACVLHGAYAVRSVPAGVGAGHVDYSLVRPLLSMGGWISVSNIISPLMSYVDRFVLGFMVSPAAVAYYATPQELVLRIGVIPSAVAAVLFPVFAASVGNGDRSRNVSDLKRYSLLILGLILPLTLIPLLFAYPLLARWISPQFAEQAAPVLQMMSIASLASGLAQVPFAMLQGTGRADLTGKLHLIELPIYFGLLYVLVLHYGPLGAAAAWLVRIVGDMAAMYCMCLRTK